MLMFTKRAKKNTVMIAIFIVISSFLLLQTKDNDKKSISTTHSRLKTRSIPNEYQHEDLKYILQWTPNYAPFNFIGDGRKIFIKNECEYTNCFSTYERSYFKSLKQFHAIIFNAEDVFQLKKSELPTPRSASQKYILASTESAHNQPCCLSHLNGFFNWTWTYKLDSDIRWGLISIYDKNGNFIGPKINMTWPSTLKPLTRAHKDAMKRKHRAVAWYNSNCVTKSKREEYASALMEELKRYGLDLDIVGKCGNLTCPKTRYDIYLCNQLVEEKYYFYLAFENSFSVDYVSENLLTALKSSTVPIVYGGADYNRFLPPGSYLDARKYSPTDLAKKIAKIINHKELYYNFFRWKNHFYYSSFWDSEEICNLCSALNNEDMYTKKTVYDNFMDWWNPEGTTYFDAIIFNGRDVFQMKSEHLPKARNSKQKYIFASLDSSFKYPECNDQFNNYFNWTWSYKLDSEILWRVFTIHNRTNNAIVAPNLDVTWYISDDPVTNEDRWRLKDILKRKTRTIAWFVSECEERSKMEENRVKSMLGQELLENYNITIDIFGGCGQEIFPYDVREEILKRDYHFYMAFEDSLTSDYVGEELLLALDGYTVPIVYGTVDYTRFLPPDSYLNFADQTVGELAAIINSSMYNTTEYETYFKWRDIYEQKRSTDSDICNLCEVLHDQEMYQNTTSYISFSDWWNPSDVVTCAT